MWAKYLSVALLACNALAAPAKGPKGFVTTSGTKFKVDGKDFYFAGSNAYVSVTALRYKQDGSN